MQGFTDEEMRVSMRAHCIRMVEAGPGWHPYVLDKAERVVRDSPMVHAGLVAEVEKQIGPKATAAARRALAWFAKGAA